MRPFFSPYKIAAPSKNTIQRIKKVRVYAFALTRTTYILISLIWRIEKMRALDLA